MDRNEILNSGLLELYVMGSLEGSELVLVNEALSKDPLLAHELHQIEQAFFLYAQAHAIAPSSTVKPMLMAKIDYMERLKQGEIPSTAPTLNSESKIKDFEGWLNRQDMQLRDDFDEIQATIIAHEPDKLTAIIWLKYGAPTETHTNEYEKFLIVEGTCDLTIGTTVHHLKAGNYLSIPLHVSHDVKVTSAIPCKIILQRVNA